MAGGYRFLAVLITVVGLTLAQSPQEPVPDSLPDVDPLLDAPAPPPGIPEQPASDMPEPPLPEMPEMPEMPEVEDPGMPPTLGGPEMPPKVEDPEMPPYEPGSMLEDPSLLSEQPVGIPDSPATPDDELAPIPLGSEDMPSPPAEGIPTPPEIMNEQPIIPGSPTNPEKPIPAPPTVSDAPAKQPSPDLFGLPPPFGIPGPFGLEDPLAFPGPSNMPDLQGLPSPFGLPGPLGAPAGSFDQLGLTSLPGFPGLLNFPGLNPPATSDKSKESDQGPSALLYGAPPTTDQQLESQQFFQQIPGLFPAISPTVQNISSLFPGFPSVSSFSPTLPTVSGVKVTSNLQQIPNSFPSLFPEPVNMKVEHSVYNVPGHFPNLAPVSGVFPSLFPPSAHMNIGQIFPDIPDFYPGLTPIPGVKTEKEPSTGSASNPDAKAEPGVQNILGFNPASPLFPGLNINDGQIPAALNFGFPPLSGLMAGKIDQNATTPPVIPGFYGLPPLQGPFENSPPLGIGTWPLLPQDAFPKLDTTTSDKTATKIKIQHPPVHTHEIHTHHNLLPSFPLGLPVPFPGTHDPFVPSFPNTIFPGLDGSIFGGVRFPVPGAVTPDTKVGKVDKVSPVPSPQPQPQPPLPPVPSPSPSPATGVKPGTGKEKIPTRDEQFTDILKELLDEVKAVQKEDAKKK